MNTTNEKNVKQDNNNKASSNASNVKQDNNNKASSNASNVKQDVKNAADSNARQSKDSKNSSYRGTKLMNDTAINGNRPRYNVDTDEDDI